MVYHVLGARSEVLLLVPVLVRYRNDVGSSASAGIAQMPKCNSTPNAFIRFSAMLRSDILTLFMPLHSGAISAAAFWHECSGALFSKHLRREQGGPQSEKSLLVFAVLL